MILETNKLYCYPQYRYTSLLYIFEIQRSEFDSSMFIYSIEIELGSRSIKEVKSTRQIKKTDLDNFIDLNDLSLNNKRKSFAAILSSELL